MAIVGMEWWYGGVVVDMAVWWLIWWYGGWYGGMVIPGL